MSEALDESVVQAEIVAILENVGDAVELAFCNAQLVDDGLSDPPPLPEAAKLFEADCVLSIDGDSSEVKVTPIVAETVLEAVGVTERRVLTVKVD